jgi:hypothetical protein
MHKFYFCISILRATIYQFVFYCMYTLQPAVSTRETNVDGSRVKCIIFTRREKLLRRKTKCVL